MAPPKAGGPASGRGGLPELLSPSAQGCGRPGLPGAVEDVASCWPSSKDQRSLLVAAAQPEGRKALPTEDVFLVSCLAGLRALGQATSSIGAGSLAPHPGQELHPGAEPGCPGDPAAQGRAACSRLRSAVTKHPCPAASAPHDCVRSPKPAKERQASRAGSVGPSPSPPVAPDACCDLVAWSYKETDPTGLDPPPPARTCFSLPQLFKDPVSWYGHIWRSCLDTSL